MKTSSFSTALIAITTGLVLFSGFLAQAREDKESEDQRPQTEMRMSQLSGHSSRVYFDHPTNSNRKIELNADYAAFMRDQKSSIKNTDSIPRADLKSMTTRKGPSVGGGGFSDSRGALVYIKKAVAHLKEVFSKFSDREIENLQSGLEVKLPPREAILQALDNIQISPNEDTWAKFGPNGHAEKLMADYRITAKGSYVVLLRRLLDTYNAEGNGTAETSIARIILHEITHLFGIGIQDDEESFVLSQRFTKAPYSIALEVNKVHSTSSNTEPEYILLGQLFLYSKDQGSFDSKTMINIKTNSKESNRLSISVHFGPGDESQFPIEGLSMNDIATRSCEILAARKFKGHSTWKVDSAAKFVHGNVEAACAAR